MNDVSLDALSGMAPIGLPRDTRGLLRFLPDVAGRIAAITREAEATGRWQVPEDIPIELRSELFWAYWVHKTAHPIIRAIPGSGVEEALRPFRQCRFDLLPQDFQTEQTWTLSAAGDLMCTPGLEAAGGSLYAHVADLLFDVDIAYANLESTLTSGEVKPMAFSMEEAPSINVTPAQYRTLVEHRGRRFDVLHLANNHILDCGEEGVRTTLAQLQADGIEQVGVNPCEEAARRPRVLEVDGLRIGWVAHTFSVNFKPFPEDKPWIVNMTPFHLEPEPDLSILEAQIRATREAGCDFVIVALHWGLEFECQPHPKQRHWARALAVAGADLIMGHHPHVVQGVEVVEVPGEPTRHVPVVYSVGNLTPVLSHPATVLSLVASLQLARGRRGGVTQTVVASMELTPVALVGDATGHPCLVRLRELWAASGRVAMRDYLAEVAAYADAAIGPHWREAGHALAAARASR